MFPGYLEFDGFGIDKLTRFWEIRASVDHKRGLRCGLRDCSHPLGAFGQSAAIYMILMSNDEYGVIKEFAIANESTHRERLNSAFDKAAKAVGAKKEYGTPRKVARGAQPEIVLKDSTILFNGRPLVLGQPLAEWQKIIGEGGVCSPKREPIAWCKWDALGIEIVGSIHRPLEVKQLKVRFNRDPEEGLYDLRAHDANGKPIDPVWQSKGIYPGFLEFDGFGIDRLTEFWEIRMSVDRQHGLRCGLRDCHKPLGAFGPNANIYMRLTTTDEHGSLRELAITSDSNNG